MLNILLTCERKFVMMSWPLKGEKLSIHLLLSYQHFLLAPSRNGFPIVAYIASATQCVFDLVIARRLFQFTPLHIRKPSFDLQN